MQTYSAPVRDMQFVLNEVLRVEDRFAELPGFEEVSAELIDSVLEQAGRLFEEVVHPTNMPGHEAGCERRPDGTVRLPDGFCEAYRAVRDAGWLGVSASPEYGGQGLPETLNFFIDEMFTSANMSLSLLPGLTHGASIAIEAHATEELRAKYLPNMVSGRWSGTMCLTESHAGTDLGMIRTRAAPRPDGSYAITGTKIFITCGEHDATENIIHLVLARLPDAPPGVKGISLFLVPKFLVGPDGEPGERNGAACVSIETKMGIEGAPTCVMSFEEATGWLVGEPHRGLACMFTMMNHERLAVGIQGLGVAEKAYQSAVAYARERLQGRSLSGPKRPDLPADPIIVHPDVRRMLQTARAWNEGARAFAGWVGLEIDRSTRHPDPQMRRKAGGPGGPAHPGGQGVPERPRVRERHPLPAGVRRGGLHRGGRDGAARPRRAHRPDLRGHERRAGERPRGPQALPERRGGGARARRGPQGVHRGAGGRRGARGVPRAVRGGVGTPPGGDGLAPRAGGREPRGAGGRRGRLPPLHRARLPRLPVGGDGGGRARARALRQLRVLLGEACDGALLHGAPPARDVGARLGHPVRGRDPDGARGGRVLTWTSRQPPASGLHHTLHALEFAAVMRRNPGSHIDGVGRSEVPATPPAALGLLGITGSAVPCRIRRTGHLPINGKRLTSDRLKRARGPVRLVRFHWHPGVSLDEVSDG